jgi:drug/metabolite transporter (DMT)-like permease
VTKIRAILLLALAVLCWSAGGVIVKSVTASPFAICGISSGIGAIVQFLLVRKVNCKPTRRLFISVLFFVAITLTVTFAIRMTTAANAMLLQFCSPAFGGLFGAIFLKQSLKPEDKWAIPLVLCGVGLFFADQIEFGHFLGNCLALLSGVAVAAYTTLIKVDNERSQIDSTIIGSAATFFVCLPFAVYSPFAVSDILPLIFCGIVVSGLGWSCYSRAIPAVTPTAALIITTPEAILNPLLVAVFIGEKPGLLALLGGAIVLAAVTKYTMISLSVNETPTAELNSNQQELCAEELVV